MSKRFQIKHPKSKSVCPPLFGLKVTMKMECHHDDSECIDRGYGPGFLPFLEILSEFSRQLMSVNVQWFSCLHILLSVEKPIGNVVLSGILNDRLHLFNLRLGHLSCSVHQTTTSIHLLTALIFTIFRKNGFRMERG